MEYIAKKYLEDLNKGDKRASIGFINNTLLGLKKRPRGIKEFAISFFWKFGPLMDVG